MPRVFSCPKCGHEIVVRFLKLGESAKCPSCGTQVPVPSSAVETEDVATPHTPVSPTQHSVDESSLPVVNRYRDAYRVGSSLVQLGKAIKIVGAILGGIIFLGSLSLGNSSFGISAIAAGIFFGALVGVLFWNCGVIVSAQGQILWATLDNAVAISPFLKDSERLDAMGLPRSIANRALDRQRQ